MWLDVLHYFKVETFVNVSEYKDEIVHEADESNPSKFPYKGISMDQRKSGVGSPGAAGEPECEGGPDTSLEVAVCCQQTLSHQQGKSGLLTGTKN